MPDLNEEIKSRGHARDILTYALAGQIRGILWCADYFPSEDIVGKMRKAVAEYDAEVERWERQK